MNKSLKENEINILHACWLSLRKMVNICEDTELQIDTVYMPYFFFLLSSNQNFFPTSTLQPPFPHGRQ